VQNMRKIFDKNVSASAIILILQDHGKE
jgi:hypothetical protein